MSKTSKHPSALPFLFLTEMWERFGYYLMIGIFQLYLTDSFGKGGWEMDRAQAADLYGTFIAFVFLTPFLGGLLADRKLGYVKSIFIGGTLMAVGYAGMAVHNLTVLYISMFLVIVGNGFFKPNISTLLGNLYNDERFKQNKDIGYNIFYMGINVGAVICNLFAAYMRNKYGWGAAFVTAGAGMVLGLIVFFLGLKHYKHADVLKPARENDTPLAKIFSNVFLPAIVVGIGSWMIPGNLLGSDSTDAFIFGCIPVVIYYASLYFKADSHEKKPVLALLVVFAVSIMFWAVFKQNGTALTTWAQFYTDREVPASIAPAVDSLYLAEKKVYKLDSVNAFNEKFQAIKESFPVYDKNGMVVLNNNGDTLKGKRQIKELGYDVYFRNVEKSQLPSEGTKVLLFNTELFQSINPAWVILLTPIVVWFFVWLRRRGKEPDTTTKIAWGLAISAISTFAMIAAVYVCSNGEIKASWWWLVSCYGIITIGELFLSPMGLSLVSKVSPQRITALMMGGWFLSTSIGNKLSGILAALWDNYDNKANFFLLNFALLGAAALIMFAILPWLRRILK